MFDIRFFLSISWVRGSINSRASVSTDRSLMFTCTVTDSLLLRTNFQTATISRPLSDTVLGISQLVVECPKSF